MNRHDKTILSLFDHSGEWSRPYREAGYPVIQIDIKHGQNVFDLSSKTLRPIYGVLMAPECTHFAGSGAQYWGEKDRDGRTASAAGMIRFCLDLVRDLEPRFWVLENPVGRLNKVVPEIAPYGPWYFQPHWYGDPYVKKTGLWGVFNKELPRNDVEPVRSCKQGSWIQKLGGKSERTKELRSKTPAGFAKAFFLANQ